MSTNWKKVGTAFHELDQEFEALRNGLSSSAPEYVEAKPELELVHPSAEFKQDNNAPAAGPVLALPPPETPPSADPDLEAEVEPVPVRNAADESTVKGFWSSTSAKLFIATVMFAGLVAFFADFSSFTE